MVLRDIREWVKFLLSIIKPNYLTKNSILKSTSEIFMYLLIHEHESIDTCNLLHTSHLHNAFACFALWKFKYINKDSLFKLLLLLSSGIGLNPGPNHMNQPSSRKEWNAFKTRGPHFIHINVNSLNFVVLLVCIMQLSLGFRNQN